MLYLILMSEQNSEKVGPIEQLLSLYPFHEEAYEPCPKDLKTIEDVKQAIATAWVSVYGLKKESDGTFTIALRDENNSSTYKISGFSEDEVLMICGE